ncbi:MAG TPA: hypothetical protein VFC35_07840 [Gemmatimonadaceae bacterium]|nr:hypothetical protein [Gemmatimonadaceae bacterium]
MRRHLGLLLVALAGCAPASIPSNPIDPAVRMVGRAHPGADTPLTPADSAWIETEMRSMSPRQRVAQLIMPWVAGEYAAVGSPEYE